ncbi:D-2-hydroxyacid dehydrogenase [Sporosarcina sp. USHLN248]|uniref:D-2-hydroxyacid dehydrogenase n=1 Tax=Sporosarcina sp. USHLN248 TaxID=3081300 RepID=UPI003019308F
MDILFTFKIKDEQIAQLRSDFPSIQFSFTKDIRETNIEKYEVIVTYGEDIDNAILERAKSLKWVMVASAGVDQMPLLEMADRGIVVTNVSGIHKTPMAESVLAHILSLCRGLLALYKQQERKDWNTRIRLKELRGSTALILGPGAIGSEIGRLLQAFGVKTVGCNRSGRQAEFIDEMIVFDALLERLPQADYVISVLPSTKETKGLWTEEHFKAMKETAVFMNFGRGDLVSEEIIVSALQENLIAHAVLDVFENEPLPESSLLWDLPNVTVSPHISSHSGKYIERSLDIFTYNLRKWIAGEKDMKNGIDAEKGY